MAASYRVQLHFVDPEAEQNHPNVLSCIVHELPRAIGRADFLFEAEATQDGWANGAELGTEDAGGEDLPFWVDVVNTTSGTIVYHRGPVKL